MNGGAPVLHDSHVTGWHEWQRGQSRQFLARLDPEAARFTFQTFDDTVAKRRALARVVHGDFERVAGKLDALQEKRAGVFVTVCATDGKGRQAHNVERVRAVFVDLDGAPLAPVLAAELEPHIVCESSPGRFHAYWLTDDCPLGEFERVQRALAGRFGGDPSVHDLPRVMRLPGFRHFKGEAQPCKLLDGIGTSGLPYRLAEIVGALHLELDAPEEKPHARPNGDGGTIEPGNRHGHLFASGRSMARRGLSREAVRAALAAENVVRCNPPVADADINELARRAFEAKHAQGWTDAPPCDDGGADATTHHPDAESAPARESAPRYPRPRDFWAAAPEAAPLDVDGTLPAPLADIVFAIAEARGHDPGMIAGALLAALSACIAQPSRIVPHEGGTWREGSALWLALIGESGRGKSPSEALAAAPLDAIERAAFAQWKDAGGDAAPETPEPERIIARDTTLEALIAAHARAAHRLLVCKDEGTAWLNGMGQYNGRAEAERGAWCSAWNCAPYNVDRITRRSLRFDDWGVSLLIGITPRQIKEAAEDARADGLLARVLPVLVRAPQAAVPSPAEGRAEDDLHRLARTIHALPEIAATLAPEARDAWQAEANKARELAAHFEASNPALASWLRKFAANALRVVLTFAAINTAAHRSRFTPTMGDRLALIVNADEMRRALALMGWFTQSAAAFFEGATPDPARDLAKELALFIAYRLHRDTEEHPRVARRDFERHSLRAWARADEPTRERAALVLHDAGWLLGAAGRPGAGIRLGQSTAWSVNPTVREAFTELAQSEADRRRAIRERLTGLGRLPATEDA